MNNWLSYFYKQVTNFINYKWKIYLYVNCVWFFKILRTSWYPINIMNRLFIKKKLIEDYINRKLNTIKNNNIICGGNKRNVVLKRITSYFG